MHQGGKRWRVVKSGWQDWLRGRSLVLNVFLLVLFLIFSMGSLEECLAHVALVIPGLSLMKPLRETSTRSK